MKKTSQKGIFLFSGVINLYWQLLKGRDEFVYISSLIFIFWFLNLVFPADIVSIVFILCFGSFLIYMIINSATKGREKKWRRLFKIINIPGSFLVLFLFLNLLLGIFPSINQNFLSQLKTLEKEFSVGLFSVFILFILSFAIIDFFAMFNKFVTGQIKERKSVWIKIVLDIIVITFFCLLFLGKIDVLFFKSLIIFVIKWFFGFSIIFLHLNFLRNIFFKKFASIK